MGTGEEAGCASLTLVDKDAVFAFRIANGGRGVLPVPPAAIWIGEVILEEHDRRRGGRIRGCGRRRRSVRGRFRRRGGLRFSLGHFGGGSQFGWGGGGGG